MAPRASAIEVFQLAEAATKEYGSVDAPSWVRYTGRTAPCLCCLHMS